MGFNAGNVLAILLKHYKLGDASIATKSEKKLANLIISQFECCIKEDDSDDEVTCIDVNCNSDSNNTSDKGC